MEIEQCAIHCDDIKFKIFKNELFKKGSESIRRKL